MNQITIDELLKTNEPKPEPPVARTEGEKVYTIPDDVWNTRCMVCTHKHSEENIPIPLWALDKAQYKNLITCRIMRLCKPHDVPGECMSFAPKFGLHGICDSCEHNNYFCEGFCMKPDHGEQHRVYYGTDYGGDARKIDYYSRHVLSVCDDYKPNQFVKEE